MAFLFKAEPSVAEHGGSPPSIPSTWEVEATELLRFQGQPGLQSEALSQRKPSISVLACPARTQEGEARQSEVQGHLSVLSKKLEASIVYVRHKQSKN